MHEVAGDRPVSIIGAALHHQMGEEEPSKVEAERETAPETPPQPPATEEVKDVAEEKPVVAQPSPPPPSEEMPDDSKALSVIESELALPFCILNLLY